MTEDKQLMYLDNHMLIMHIDEMLKIGFNGMEIHMAADCFCSGPLGMEAKSGGTVIAKPEMQLYHRMYLDLTL